ncbi:MAG: hypothetical protein KAT15_25995, partial [Bacteroidales bacterium]|nr:hypothetical protein [Bacteroidales bacterium]
MRIFEFYTMRLLIKSIYIILASLLIAPVLGQKAGLQSINSHDLKMHMEFLASDELEGRNTGEQGLQVAARYLAVQAKQLGLQPADPEHGFFQHYTVREKSYDRGKSQIIIRQGDSTSTTSRESFYVFPEIEGEQLSIEGEVVFAGYGIRDEDHDYNDFENIDIAGKMVLIMDRAPMNEEGTDAGFDPEKWTSIQNMQYKMPYIFSQGPRAVLLVTDPKSGLESIEDAHPAIVSFLSRSRSIKPDHGNAGIRGDRPNIFLIHRNVADQLLEGT